MKRLFMIVLFFVVLITSSPIKADTYSGIIECNKENCSIHSYVLAFGGDVNDWFDYSFTFKDYYGDERVFELPHTIPPWEWANGGRGDVKCYGVTKNHYPYSITCSKKPGYILSINTSVSEIEGSADCAIFKVTCEYRYSNSKQDGKDNLPDDQSLPLPEDEIGAYYFENGIKKYAWLRTKELCYEYLGIDYCENNPDKYEQK